jgi:DNA polymerase-3 subunit delta'
VSPPLYPWQQGPWETIVAAIAEDRLAHGLLVHGLPGLGKAQFAEALAALLLCSTSSACGQCPPCRWVAADNHPDLHRLAPEEDKRTISVDQVRALIARLSLSSMATGRKVALIDPANVMTEAAANSLLKTLEEPAGDSVLVLVTPRLSVLPATIVSRCQGVAIGRPATEDAMAWLAQQGKEAADWPALLRLANGAPLAALALHSEGFGATVRELSDDLKSLSDGRAEPSAVATRWVRKDAARCLDWLSRRVADVIRVRCGVATRDVAHNLTPKDLPEHLNQIKLNALFRYLDHVQTASRRLESLNAQQVVETVLIPWALRFRDYAR